MVIVPEPKIRKLLLVIDSTRHWPSIGNLFFEKKNIKVKGRHCPDE